MEKPVVINIGYCGSQGIYGIDAGTRCTGTVNNRFCWPYTFLPAVQMKLIDDEHESQPNSS
jgi:hypothetical protein